MGTEDLNTQTTFSDNNSTQRKVSGLNRMFTSYRPSLSFKQRMSNFLHGVCRWSFFHGRSSNKDHDVLLEQWACEDSESILKTFEDCNIDFENANSLRLPLEPWDAIHSIQPEKCQVLNSAMAPVVLAFAVERKNLPMQPIVKQYAVKVGDDLRQDALVLQMFRLMDLIWEHYGLWNVQLKPNGVVPVTPTEGVLAFVPQSQNIATILQDFEGRISKFIQVHNDHTGPKLQKAHERFCGSCAAYCVATYLIGVGDRHLDNLMIAENGHFFHIDFGFILGDDPKPRVPAIRVPLEVVTALREIGVYDEFDRLVGEAFILVRRTARLWTRLLILMATGGGQGISMLEKDPGRGVDFIRERLHLDMDEKEAQNLMQNEVKKSASSLVHIVWDKIHGVGQFCR